MVKRKDGPGSSEPVGRRKSSRTHVVVTANKSQPIRRTVGTAPLLVKPKPAPGRKVSDPSASRESAFQAAPQIIVKRVYNKAAPPAKLPFPTTDFGQGFIYGANDAGQLSLEDPGTQKRFPFPLAPEKFGGQDLVKVICGGLHSAAITADGKAWTWGCNDEGALGTARATADEAEKEESDWKPAHVSAIREKVVDISAGDSHTAFLTEDGQIYLTGTMRDASGAFGLQAHSSQVVNPYPFLLVDPKPKDPWVSKDRATRISSGQNHFGYVNSKNEIHLLGDMSNGQLGPVPRYKVDGGRQGKQYFLQRRKVNIRGGRSFVGFANVQCTPYATFVQDSRQDRWFACGNNMKNQLGFVQENPELNGIQTEWQEVEGLRHQKIVKIVGTAIQTLAVTAEGSLLVFGDKEYLALSETAESGTTEAPVMHPFFKGEDTIRDVDCSSNNAVVCVLKNGDLYVWGSPASSLLALDPDDDDAENMMKPTKVISKNTQAYKMVQIAAGASHAILVGLKREEEPMDTTG